MAENSENLRPGLTTPTVQAATIGLLMFQNSFIVPGPIDQMKWEYRIRVSCYIVAVPHIRNELDKSNGYKLVPYL